MTLKEDIAQELFKETELLNPTCLKEADSIITLIRDRIKGAVLTPDEKGKVFKDNCQTINLVVDSIAAAQLSKVLKELK